MRRPPLIVSTHPVNRAELFASAAKSAGLEARAAKHFYAHRNFLHRKQLEFVRAALECDRQGGPTDIGFGGARGGGKSYASLALLAFDCMRQPELKALFLRKHLKSARESFGDLRRMVLRNVPHTYREYAGVVDFPNGSQIILGHYGNESDIDKYLGLEYDVVAIEEATTLRGKTIANIKTVVRTSKPNWRPRRYYTTNPGGVGHAEFKREFILPYRTGTETTTRFIPSTVDDNPMVNVEYKGELDKLQGWQHKAWRYGDWDIAAGQYFSNFRSDVHVVAPFEIPNHWPVWGGFDYGFTHYTAFYLFAKDSDGNVYAIGEHAERKQLPAYHIEQMQYLADRLVGGWNRVQSVFAGPDVFGKKGAETTIAEQYQGAGMWFTPANNDRVSGWTSILNALGDGDRGIPPRLKIFNTCARLIECLPELQHDPNRPEDVLKVDTDDEGNGGDDFADAFRYGFMNAARVFNLTSNKPRVKYREGGQI